MRLFLLIVFFSIYACAEKNPDITGQWMSAYKPEKWDKTGNTASVVLSSQSVATIKDSGNQKWLQLQNVIGGKPATTTEFSLIWNATLNAFVSAPNGSAKLKVWLDKDQLYINNSGLITPYTRK